MVHKLPCWQSSFLAHLLLDSVQTVERKKQLLEGGEKLQLHLVRDGGANEDLSSFSWELAVGCTILRTCVGPTFGLEPRSF